MYYRLFVGCLGAFRKFVLQSSEPYSFEFSIWNLGWKILENIFGSPYKEHRTKLLKKLLRQCIYRFGIRSCLVRKIAGISWPWDFPRARSSIDRPVMGKVLFVCSLFVHPTQHLFSGGGDERVMRLGGMHCYVWARVDGGHACMRTSRLKSSVRIGCSVSSTVWCGCIHPSIHPSILKDTFALHLEPSRASHAQESSIHSPLRVWRGVGNKGIVVYL